MHYNLATGEPNRTIFIKSYLKTYQVSIKACIVIYFLLSPFNFQIIISFFSLFIKAIYFLNDSWTSLPDGHINFDV